MRKVTITSVIIFNLLLFYGISAQTLPLVYDIENTGADCPIPYLPSFSELPIIQPLPDPFEWSDGRGRMENIGDWRYRRAEIGAEILNYEIGPKPIRPDTITASYSGGVLTVQITVKGETLTLTSNVILPAGAGPFPAVIGMNSPSGGIPSDIFSSRNIAQITYSHNQVTTYYNHKNSDPYYKLYPDLNIDNTGQYSAWIWGVSRLIDGLELVQDDLPIDLHRLAVTGCSYAGKMALFAGAFDERIALTIAQESGGGGAPSWRYSHSEPSGSVEKIDNTDYNWFKNSMSDFGGDNVWHMPEDHHELLAMVAPRALLATGNTNYTWLSNPSCYVSSKACQEVYNALGISDRFGYFIDGDHNHCEIPATQRLAIEAFVDKFLMGIDTVNTNVTIHPYSIDLDPWITWTTPTLGNDTSYFGRAQLIYPENLQTDLDSIITFKWSKVEDAEKYFLQVSLDPTFKSITMNDSLSDTLKTFTGFLKGKKYYWRVQIKNSAGELGPWSDQWNFITYIPLPAVPEKISASSYPERADYAIFKWKTADYASQYRLQVSRLTKFSPVAVPTVVTTDTFKILTGLNEGQKYYWRVQGINIKGDGSWSDTTDFMMINTPSDLTLESLLSNRIKLAWKDNSKAEHGYIIERIQSPDTVFALLDTLKGSGEEYVDTSVVVGQTYTYRVKAYKDSMGSEYSNEASLLYTGINEIKEIPIQYELSQNFPNPFNPATKIKLSLLTAGFTKIIVYDLVGREIRTLVNKELRAGYHEVVFDGRNLPSGIYFYKVQSGNFSAVKKMVLMK
ncbi:MAG: T9SS type A sorting domain-containing protein [Calditrichaceae bacterium]|nr:T9SS type A sorting domain-containing protein [Calditrichaceae bacterium]MBN2707956.1 T9SS type A sorting domain-containing protein [Calditrichaceae bacterium]